MESNLELVSQERFPESHSLAFCVIILVAFLRKWEDLLHNAYLDLMADQVFLMLLFKICNLIARYKEHSKILNLLFLNIIKKLKHREHNQSSHIKTLGSVAKSNWSNMPPR